MLADTICLFHLLLFLFIYFLNLFLFALIACSHDVFFELSIPEVAYVLCVILLIDGSAVGPEKPFVCFSGEAFK